MKISIDNVEILTLSEIQKQVIQSDISSDIFEKPVVQSLQIQIPSIHCPKTHGFGEGQYIGQLLFILLSNYHSIKHFFSCIYNCD